MPKTYFVHDNGGRPFKVEVLKTRIKIYTEDKYNQIDENSDYDPVYDKLIYTIDSYKEIFIGEDPNHKGDFYYQGNSILVKITNHNYIFIGWVIYRFSTDDVIVDYVSTIGNNDVPYPYAIGTENTYLMIAEVMIPNKYLKEDDPYKQYYDYNEEYLDDKKYFTKIKFKMIQKRL